MPNNINAERWFTMHRPERRTRRNTVLQLGFSGVFLIALGTGVGHAKISTTATASLCDRAAQAASKAHGVPLDVLKAITRTETGRTVNSGLHPWPWTVNMEGAGRWFASEDEARAYVFSHFKKGARSFDVGCFQINYRWHGAAFRSIDDMFDPALNAEYAAKFLMELYLEHGNWPAAAGAYHSRTPAFAKAYTARFKTIRKRVAEGQPTTDSADDSSFRQVTGRGLDLARLSSRPFVGKGASTLGSLVPTEGSNPNRRAFVAID